MKNRGKLTPISAAKKSMSEKEGVLLLAGHFFGWAISVSARHLPFAHSTCNRVAHNLLRRLRHLQYIIIYCSIDGRIPSHISAKATTIS